MTDVSLAWPLADPSADLAIASLDLAHDEDGLQTAVLVSLFSDARADPDELPPGETDRRGWWGDLLADGPIGSKLWLLEREKETPETAVRAAGYAREALQWLVDDGAARAVDVSAEWADPGRLVLSVSISTPGGDLEWSFDWRLRTV